MSSLPRCSSTVRAPLCAALSSASSGSVCTRERTHRAFQGILQEPATLFSSGLSRAHFAPAVKTSALYSPSENSSHSYFLTAVFAHGKFHRARFCGCMNRKGRQTRRNYQVLRSTDASPRGVNCIFVIRRGSRGFAGLAPHSGRSSKSHSVVLCSGLWKTSLITTGPEGPHQDNRASIGKRRTRVNPFQYDLIVEI